MAKQDIDWEKVWEKVEMYTRAGGEDDDIVNILGIQLNVLQIKCIEYKGISFEDYKVQQLSIANLQLLAKQYNMAMKGDRGMLEMILINRLGQVTKSGKKLPTMEHNQCLTPKPINNDNKAKSDKDW